MSAEFDLNKEPLWAIPQPVQERLNLELEPRDYANFKLSVLYSGVAVFFLLLFSGSAFMEGNATHGVALLVFAAVTIAGLAALWLGHWYEFGKHVTTAMMGLLCLYLFYSGGVQNTGPLFYGVFPSVALFLHGRLRGFIWVVALLLLTIMLAQGVFGFDVSRYSSVFVARIIAITLIIATLTCIPEYFRIKAERSLLLSLNDIESLSYGDAATRLANRTLLEKMLMLEFNRHRRYGTDCGVLMVETDPLSPALANMREINSTQRLLTMVAEVLRGSLRVQDVAGRWDNQCFLLILPECTLEGAIVLSERLLTGIRTAAAASPIQPLRITASIGVASIEHESEQGLLKCVSGRLADAKRRGGNCFVAN